METETMTEKEAPNKQIKSQESGHENNEGQAPVEAHQEDNQPNPADNKDGDSKKSDNLFPHEQVMKKAGIEFKSLPTTELKMGVNAWNMGMRKYKKNPSDKLLDGMRKSSIKLADSIQNYLEKDLPEKSEEEIKAEQAAKIKLQKDAQEKIARERREREARERERLEALKRQKEKREQELRRAQMAEEANAPEKKVMEIINQKGKIHYRELKEIIGHGNIGEAVTIGSVTLLNIPFTNSYKLYKG